MTKKKCDNCTYRFDRWRDKVYSYDGTLLYSVFWCPLCGEKLTTTK